MSQQRRSGNMTTSNKTNFQTRFRKLLHYNLVRTSRMRHWRAVNQNKNHGHVQWNSSEEIFLLAPAGFSHMRRMHVTGHMQSVFLHASRLGTRRDLYEWGSIQFIQLWLAGCVPVKGSGCIFHVGGKKEVNNFRWKPGSLRSCRRQDS